MVEKTSDLDVIIIGAGPAGLSASRWCLDLGLKTILLEREPMVGGQLHSIFNAIQNYLGVDAKNGRDLLDRFLDTTSASKADTKLAVEVVDIEPAAKSVLTSAGVRLNAKSLIIATGVARRTLNIPGESAFTGHGIMRSGSEQKRNAQRKRVLIVGGGDAALENALILAEFAEKVYVVNRRPEFSARTEFSKKAGQIANIEFRMETVVTTIRGGKSIDSVELLDLASRTTKEIAVDLILIRIGVEPNTKILKGKIDLDANGYILVNASCETSSPQVFAVGDVANPLAPTIISAAGMGATAAKAIKAYHRSRTGLR